MDEAAKLHPLERSGVDRTADVISEMSVLEPLEHSVRKEPLDVGGESVGSRTGSNPLEHSGVGLHVKPLSGSLPRMYSDKDRDGRGGPRDHRGDDGTLRDLREEAKRGPPEEGEAIFVGLLARRHRGF